MAANWTPIPMYTSTKGVESDIVSWDGAINPIILNEKAVHAIHDLIEGQVEILPLKHTSLRTTMRLTLLIYYTVSTMNMLNRMTGVLLKNGHLYLKNKRTTYISCSIDSAFYGRFSYCFCRSLYLR